MSLTRSSYTMNLEFNMEGSGVFLLRLGGSSLSSQLNILNDMVSLVDLLLLEKNVDISDLQVL